MNIRVIERRLRRDYRLPDAFEFFRWECFPKTAEKVIYVELEGGFCPLLKSGPNKGRRNWKKAHDKKTFQVTMIESEQWVKDYIEETKCCPRCMGRGEVMVRAEAGKTTTYGNCHHCGGTGKWDRIV